MATPRLHGTQPQPSSTSFRHDSIISEQLNPLSVSLPVGYQLIVTTKNCVYSWDQTGVTELFKSETGGIVAAKKLSGDGETLAVADSQVVVMHNNQRGRHRTYKLKGSEVWSLSECALLKRLTVVGSNKTSQIHRKRLSNPLLHDQSEELSPGFLDQRSEASTLASHTPIASRSVCSFMRLKATAVNLT